MDDKITKISEILDKYNFRLSNTNIDIKLKEKIIQDMMNIKLDTILDSMVDSRNCISEIMRVVYNVKELEEVVKETQ